MHCRRRLTRQERKKQRKIIVASVIGLLFVMSIGYAAFKTNLNINAKGNIKDNSITISELRDKYCNTTEEDGLYIDIYEEGKCIYKGTNPNNYITFNDELWRIVSIESDNSIKIIKSDPLENHMAYDTSGKTGFAESTLSEYLNNDYFQSLIDKDKVIEKNFYAGMLENGRIDKSILEIINFERQEIYSGKIGLLSFSEYMKGSANSECNSFVDARPITNNSPCHLNNFLHSFKEVGGLWLLNSITSEQAYSIWNDPLNVTHPYTISYYDKNKSVHENNNSLFRVTPVINLSSNIKLKGKGIEAEPYIIVN